MKDFCLVGDSCIDFSLEEIKNKDIRLVSINTVLDGIEYGLNKETISLDDFFAKIKEGKSHTTVACNPSTYEKYFEEILEEGKDILYIAFSSALSSSFANAKIAIESLKDKYPERKIEIVDSRSASVLESLVLDMAYEKKKIGWDIDEIKTFIENSVEHTKVEFVVDDLFYLHKGGRLSITKAILGSALKIVPILSEDKDGKLYMEKSVRGRKKAIHTILSNIKENIDLELSDKIYISYSSDREEAENLKRELGDLGFENVLIYPMSLTIAAHTGPGTVVVAFAIKNKRD